MVRTGQSVRRCWRIAAVLVVAAAGLLPAEALSQAPHPDPTTNPIPQFPFGQKPKSMLIKLHFNGPTAVSLVSAAGVFGRAQANIGKPPMLRVRLFDHYDTVVSQFNEWSPLLVEALGLDPEVTFVPAATGLVTFPFNPALRTMSVTDVALNQLLIEVDLTGPILDFCAANPTEPECGVDLAVLSVTAVDPPAELLVGEQADITLRTVVTNHGPLGIMDTSLTTAATATPGSSVTPPQLAQEAPALIIGEERELEQVFTVGCQSFSAHPFRFESTIAPLNPVFVDPDPSNNAAVVDVPLECVLPVVINIKPRSAPNSLNVQSGGETAVAVLTTTAGEYGMPLAFDATRIVPASVRFGPREVVFSESGGVAATVGLSHTEDSYELDERTRDGDQDMVLHFKAREAGFQVGDVEACVKGQWLDSEGNPHKFFGCDMVRIAR